MAKPSSRSYILTLLRKRNAKELSFKEIINDTSKLLEKIDYMKKNQQHLCTFKGADNENDSPEVIQLKAKCHSLQKELAECHCKISSLAEQVINIKDELDDKNKLFTKQSAELKHVQGELQTSQEACKAYKSQVDSLKKTLQERIDDYNTLNITFSSIIKKLSDLEIENSSLKKEFEILKAQNDKLSKPGEQGILTTAKNSADLTTKVTRKESVSEIKASTVQTLHSNDVALPRRKKHEFVAHDDCVNAVLWLPDSPVDILTAGADRRVKRWEVTEKGVDLKVNVRDCNSAILSLDTDSETRFVLSASCDFASRVWTVSDFLLKHTLTGHSGKVLSAKFLKDQCKIVSGSADQTLKLWDFRHRVCTVTYTTHSAANDVLSKDSNCIVSGHSDSKIRFWDTRIDTEIANVSTTGRVTSLDVSSNGLYLLASEDNQLKLFDTRTNKELNYMSAAKFAVGCNFTRAKFNPNGNYVCCGSKNGSIFIWNPFTGALEKELKSDDCNVICCSWSPCGSHLASCGSNYKCTIWSM